MLQGPPIEEGIFRAAAVIFAAHAHFASSPLGYNGIMADLRSTRRTLLRRLPSGIFLASLALLSACKPAEKPRNEQSNQMAMWLDSVPDLKSLNVSNAEIGELSKAHGAGLSDAASVVLVRNARERKETFTNGQSIADLLRAGSSEQTVLELARLNQLGVWTGQAAAMRLAGISDKIILAVAQRRSKGLTVLSGQKLGELKNTGVSDAEIQEMVERGDSDETATRYIAARERAAGGHKFVFQTRAHK
jgi:hypothetical protein